MLVRLLISSLTFATVLAACGPVLPQQTRLPEARCRAAGAEGELGRIIDDEAAESARMAAGAMRARIVRPGQMVTMDADPQRLNIEVDEAGRIRRLRCG